MDYFSG